MNRMGNFGGRFLDPDLTPSLLPRDLPVWGAFVGLACIEILIALIASSGAAIYGLIAIFAIVLLYGVLRYPPLVAYVALFWLLFEKSVAHSASITSLLSTAGDAILVLGLFFAILVNLVRRRTPVLTLGPIGVGLIVFTVLSIVSTLINDVPIHVAELGILDSTHAVIMFLIIINIGIRTTDVHRLAYVLVGVMSVAALIGVMQIIPHSPAWIVGGQQMHASGSLIRVTGPFDHPISFANYLAMTLPLGLALLVWGKVSGGYRTLLAAGCALMLLALLFTFTRESWIALPLAMIFLGLTVERKLVKPFIVYVMPAGVVLAVLFAPFSDRLLQITHGNLRWTLFEHTWPLITSHLLFGVGPGRFGGHVALITHTPLYAQYHMLGFFYGTGNQIDMFWTHLVAEAGIAGALAFFSMIIGCFFVGRKAYQTAEDPRRRAILLGLLFAIPVTVFVSFVSATLEAGPGATLFWGLMGMLTVLAINPETAVESAWTNSPVLASRRILSRRAIATPQPTLTAPSTAEGVFNG